MHLILAEKPSQAKQYADAFGGTNKGDHFHILPCLNFPQGAIVVSAAGHLVQACEPADYKSEWKEWTIDSLPIIPEKFQYKVIESKKRFYNTIKKFVQDPKVKTVIIGSDCAREGELLARLPLLLMGNKKPIKRLWTSSLTKEAIRKAFNNLKDIKEFDSLYYEALARQRADWMMGISATRALTCLLANNGLIPGNTPYSVGRVQTALMGIIYQREKEIEEFVSEPYWDCYANFTFGNKNLIAKWFNEETDHIFSKEVAETLVEYCANREAQVYSVKKEEKKIRPPQFFNLDTLQTEANRLYGMSPETVLNIAQKLYEKTYISYPRSGSRHVTPEEAKQFPTILENLSAIQEYSPLIKGDFRDISADKRYTDSSKVDDHYAIILTEEQVNPLSLPKGEQQIYDLIARNIISAHYPDHVYDSTEIIIVLDNAISFKNIGKQVKEPGWKDIYQSMSMGEEENEEEDILLPHLEEGETGNFTSLELKEGMTKAKTRLSEGDLIKVMSNAAYYIENRKDFTNDELSLGTSATRAGIIATIKSKYIKVEKNLVYLRPEGRILIEAIGQNSHLTSVLTTGKMEQFLADIGKGKESMDDFLERTKKVTKMIVNKMIKDSSTWDFSQYKSEIQETETIGICPLCRSPIMDKGKFYGCSGYQQNQCNFTIPKERAGRPITKDNAIKLIETGSTALIKNFKSKSKDKMFDAYLVWDQQKQMVVYKFPNEMKG